MTREEAIIKINTLRNEYNDRYIDYCGVNEAVNMAIDALQAEPQRAYDQGVKDTLDKYDETCRIASDIRCAMGYKTERECRELIRNGEIQRVKHGRWEYTDYGGVGNWHCSVCHNIVVGAKSASLRTPYCPNCGAKMDGEENG